MKIIVPWTTLIKGKNKLASFIRAKTDYTLCKDVAKKLKVYLCQCSQVMKLVQNWQYT